VVLVAPEIHWNTGNIGRTCLGAGARLHLIRPLGFSLDSRQVKRAGLDYWERVPLDIWDSFDAFCEALNPKDDEMALFLQGGGRFSGRCRSAGGCFWCLDPRPGAFPAAILSRYPRARYRIPITGESDR
jgi:tRNA (cytidine/uridine-2'-O-)-methyltransferase